MNNHNIYYCQVNMPTYCQRLHRYSTSSAGFDFRIFLIIKIQGADTKIELKRINRERTFRQEGFQFFMVGPESFETGDS